jgi:hypothetical protein
MEVDRGHQQHLAEITGGDLRQRTRAQQLGEAILIVGAEGEAALRVLLVPDGAAEEDSHVVAMVDLRLAVLLLRRESGREALHQDGREQRPAAEVAEARPHRARAASTHEQCAASSRREPHACPSRTESPGSRPTRVLSGTGPLVLSDSGHSRTVSVIPFERAGDLLRDDSTAGTVHSECRRHRRNPRS